VVSSPKEICQCSKLHTASMLAFWTEFQKFGRWWKYLRFNLTCSLLIERSFKL